MKKAFWIISILGLASTMGFGATATLVCTPQVGSASSSIVNQSLFFAQAVGTGSFLCSDASLGPLTLSGVTVSILTDYTKGNGGAADPANNSAGFTFSSNSTWAPAQAGGFATTMSLNNVATNLTAFVTGNLSSMATTFTNTTSGGLTGTAYTQPITDAEVALSGTSLINVTAFVDAGAFTAGASDASVMVTYNYTPTTTPEPVSIMLLGSGLVVLSMIGRKKLARK